MAKASAKPVAREYTIHLHKHIFHVQFKKRAPTAIRAVKKFAQEKMNTKDVRLDVSVNKYIWSKGIKSVPDRIRVRCTRKASEEGKGKMYTVVEWVPVATFKGLQTTVVEDKE